MYKKFVREVMANNSDLPYGKTRLVAIQPAKNGLVQLMFVEKIENKSNRRGLDEFLVGHENVTSTSLQAGWQPATLASVKNLFPDLYDKAKQVVESGEPVEVKVNNPLSSTGKRWRLEIVETLTASEWDENNLEISAKRQGADGHYLSHEGYAIFRNVDIVRGDPQHILISHTSTVEDPFDLRIFQRAGENQPDEADKNAQDAQKKNAELTEKA